MNTLKTVQHLLAQELSIDVAMLDPTRPLDELGIDSLTLIECMFKLEDKFGISVATSEMKIATLSDIVEMVDRLVAEQADPETRAMRS
jgi:acyl carrier protein